MFEHSQTLYQRFRFAKFVLMKEITSFIIQKQEDGGKTSLFNRRNSHDVIAYFIRLCVGGVVVIRDSQCKRGVQQVLPPK